MAVRRRSQQQAQRSSRLLLIEDLHLRSNRASYRQAMIDADFNRRQWNPQLPVDHPRLRRA